MAEPFRLRALSASIGVNAVALLLAFSASPNSLRPWPGTTGVTGSGHGAGWLVFDEATAGGIVRNDAVRTCPVNEYFDRPAFPVIPTGGAGALFTWVVGDGLDPLICLQVAADGSVAAAFLVHGGGGARDGEALLRRARQLRFMPARRGGRAVASWGVLRIDPEAGSSQWVASVTARAWPLPSFRTD